MRAMTRTELDAVARWDLAREPKFSSWKYCSAGMALRRFLRRTRFANFLTVSAGGDVEVRTVAIKVDNGGLRRVKEVVRAAVGERRMEARDLAYFTMSGYRVDWSPEGWGRRCEWNEGHEGRWGAEDYSRRGKWRLRCPVVNAEVLAGTERWRWCAWNERCGDILGYLKLYSERPGIEMLVKVGLPRFAAMPGFAAQMDRDRGFVRFVARHAAEIREGGIMADVVRKAFRLGVGFGRAADMIRARRSFGGGLPTSVDAERACAYVAGQRGMTKWEYCDYLRKCAGLGQDLADTKVCFPRDGHGRMAAVRALEAERRMAADKAARRRLAADLRERAARFGAVCRAVRGGLVAHVPAREAEFRREGRELEHCVWAAGYAGKMARGECVVVFVRAASAPDRPFVTVELSPEGRVLQCYGKNNGRPDDAVLEFVRRSVAPAVARIAKRERRKAGVGLPAAERGA